MTRVNSKVYAINIICGLQMWNENCQAGIRAKERLVSKLFVFRTNLDGRHA
jgi:hypothetical protein